MNTIIVSILSILGIILSAAIPIFILLCITVWEDHTKAFFRTLQLAWCWYIGKRYPPAWFKREWELKRKEHRRQQELLESWYENEYADYLDEELGQAKPKKHSCSVPHILESPYSSAAVEAMEHHVALERIQRRLEDLETGTVTKEYYDAFLGSITIRR